MWMKWHFDRDAESKLLVKSVESFIRHYLYYIWRNTWRKVSYFNCIYKFWSSSYFTLTFYLSQSEKGIFFLLFPRIFFGIESPECSLLLHYFYIKLYLSNIVKKSKIGTWQQMQCCHYQFSFKHAVVLAVVLYRNRNRLVCLWISTIKHFLKHIYLYYHLPYNYK